MIKIIILLVFVYNMLHTVTDPTAQNTIMCICFLAIGLGLVLSTSKKILSIILKVVAIVAIIGYALIQFGVITL